MSYADFHDSVPAVVRLLLTLVVTVGLSVLLVYAFHGWILRINADPPSVADGADAEIAPAPGVKDLSGRLIALTTFAFVFLLGFGFSQFWVTAKDARDAVINEAIAYQRVVAEAQRLPPDQGGPLLTALDAYRQDIVRVEWPLMEAADSTALAAARFDASERLVEAVYSAKSSGSTQDPVWPQIGDAVDDLLSDAIDRTNALPSPMAVSVIVLVCSLGIANLVAIALFQPARKKANIALVAAMAAITAFLMFALAEISNPYNGASAISMEILQR